MDPKKRDTNYRDPERIHWASSGSSGILGSRDLPFPLCNLISFVWAYVANILYNGTKSGWTDEDCSFDYLKNLFIPNTKHLQKPLLLIFDGHYSHLSIKSVRLSIEHNICILCLPSHSTHLLQPLHIYTLKYVKQQWKELLWERNKTTSTKLNKRDFIQLFSKLYNFALIPAHCSATFAKAGIFPFDRRAIKNDRIIKNGPSVAATPFQHFFQAHQPSLIPH